MGSSLPKTTTTKNMKHEIDPPRYLGPDIRTRSQHHKSCPARSGFDHEHLVPSKSRARVEPRHPPQGLRQTTLTAEHTDSKRRVPLLERAYHWRSRWRYIGRNVGNRGTGGKHRSAVGPGIHPQWERLSRRPQSRRRPTAPLDNGHRGSERRLGMRTVVKRRNPFEQRPGGQNARWREFDRQNNQP